MRAAKLIVVTSLVIFGFAAAPGSSTAASSLPEHDPQEITREAGYDSTLYPNSELDRKRSQINRSLQEGLEYFNHKEYQKALNAAREVKRIERDSSADELEAKCLANIGRPIEAIAMLKKVNWRTKVYVYETLGKHQQALNACVGDVMDVDQVVFKAEMLLKDGNRSEAIRIVQNSYFYWMGLGQVPPQVAKFFADHNLPVPQPKIDQKLQTDLVSILGKLAAMPKPPLNREAAALQAEFDRKFAISGRDSRGFSYSSRRMQDAAAIQVGLLHSDRASTRNAEEVWIRTNYGGTILKPDDVATMFKDLGPPKMSPAGGLGEVLLLPMESMEFALPNAVLSFQFVGDDKHLASAAKTWSLPPLKVKAVGKPFVEPTLADVQRDIKKARYKQAAQETIIICLRADVDVEKAEKLRVVLGNCYDLLKRPEVANYIRVAPWRHLIHAMIAAQDNPDKLNTTLFQYNHSPWKVRGPATKESGAYTVTIPGADSFDTYGRLDPDIYGKLFEIIGPLQDYSEREIAPLPTTLVDRIQLHRE